MTPEGKPIAEIPAAGPRSDIDLWSEEVLADPYPTYRVLRDLGPVVWLPAYGVAALFRFADVRSALADYNTFSSAQGLSVAESTREANVEGFLSTDPPETIKHQRMLGRQLAPKALNNDVDEVRRMAEAFVDAVLEKGEFDGAADLARPYSLDVVASLAGLPDDDRRRQIPHQAESAFNMFGPPGERQVAALEAWQKLFVYNEEVRREGLPSGSRGAELIKAGRPYDITAYTFPGIDTTVNGRPHCRSEPSWQTEPGAADGIEPAPTTMRPAATSLRRVRPALPAAPRGAPYSATRSGMPFYPANAITGTSPASAIRLGRGGSHARERRRQRLRRHLG
ncbi:hypothetical protein ACQP1W_27760 [Spirillospora sp. CA-255316]